VWRQSDPGVLGQDHRHRLNRGGDRQANNASWVITLTRLRIDPATRGYAQRRSTQGKTTKEVMRCLIGGLSRSRLEGRAVASR
jgi:transposase